VEDEAVGPEGLDSFLQLDERVEVREHLRAVAPLGPDAIHSLLEERLRQPDAAHVEPPEQGPPALDQGIHGQPPPQLLGPDQTRLAAAVNARRDFDADLRTPRRHA